MIVLFAGLVGGGLVFNAFDALMGSVLSVVGAECLGLIGLAFFADLFLVGSTVSGTGFWSQHVDVLIQAQMPLTAFIIGGLICGLIENATAEDGEGWWAALLVIAGVVTFVAFWIQARVLATLFGSAAFGDKPISDTVSKALAYGDSSDPFTTSNAVGRRVLDLTYSNGAFAASVITVVVIVFPFLIRTGIKAQKRPATT